MNKSPESDAERTIEIVAPILGCNQLEDCKASTLPLQLFTEDVTRLQKGLPTEHGVTWAMRDQERITFAATCLPGTCGQAGSCALKGFFVETTPDMANAQDAEHVEQSPASE